MRLLATAALLCLAVGASANSFHDQVVALYSYSPRSLDEKQLEAKSKELDEFWYEVETRGESGLEDLRLELVRLDASPFFSYDGAKLLLSLSEKRVDQALALESIGRTDLKDIQWTDYFLTVHWLAVQGFDTTEAAFKVLSEPTFEVFIVEHYLTLGQDMCLAYLLMPTEESFYLNKAESRLFEETDVTAQKSLLALLANTTTRIGDLAVARFAADPQKPAASREYARLILESIREMAASPMSERPPRTYDSLKREQRTLFARVSDEALHEWELLRLKLRSIGPQ